jgi:hypothetical protein
MSRRYPVPPHRAPYAENKGCISCSFIVFLVSFIMAVVYAKWGWWIVAGFSALGFIMGIYAELEDKIFWIKINNKFRRSSKRGIIFLSNTRSQYKYLEKHIISRFKDYLIVIKRSENDKLKKSIEGRIRVNIFGFSFINSTSAVIMRLPEKSFTVYYFNNALRDCTMGNCMALETMAYLLAKELGLSLNEWPSDLEIIEDARKYFKEKSLAGFLVTRDTLKWKKYFEKYWLPKFSRDFEILNWSQRKLWTDTPATRYFYRFCWPNRFFFPCIVLVEKDEPENIILFNEAWRLFKQDDLRAMQSLEKYVQDEIRNRIKGEL